MDRHDVELLMSPDSYAADLVAAFRRRPSWHADAACAEPQYDVSLFFPARGERTDEAKAVCAGCLVRAECGQFADDKRAAPARLPPSGPRAHRPRRPPGPG